jgi:serine/threonine protein kinase
MYCFKIADFGVARLSLPTNSHFTIPPVVPDYLAPEISTGKYDLRVDLFSLGHAMWQLTCSSPAPDLDFQNLYRDLKSFDPNARPSLDTILDVAGKKLRDASLPTPVPQAIQYMIRPPVL